MQSTTSSTRTFMAPPSAADKPAEGGKKGRRLSVKRIAPWLIVLALCGVSGYLLLQYRTAQAQLQAGDGASNQISSLVNQVRKLVVLPAGETPTVATVVNANKLRGQTFFASAQDGDKVLVYNREKEAILYRPATNQIVTIAPVSVTSKAGSTAANLTKQ